jgi:hypothetical protein
MKGKYKTTTSIRSEIVDARADLAPESFRSETDHNAPSVSAHQALSDGPGHGPREEGWGVIEACQKNFQAAYIRPPGGSPNKSCLTMRA